MLQAVDSSPLLGSPDHLSTRLDRDGYLFFRGLLPQPQVEEVADAVLTRLGDRRWLAAADPSPRTAWAAPPPDCHEEDDDYWQTYAAVQSLEVFHRLGHSAELASIRQAVLGPNSFTLPLKVLRMIRPYATQLKKTAHRDYAAFGIPGMLTAWLPLVDCQQELGGLKILAGSHKNIPADYPVRELSGDLTEWVSTDYHVGDVIVFHCLTVHSGQPNRTKDRIRLSADFRWQSTNIPVPEWACQPHQAARIPGWEELTQGWSSLSWIDVPAGVATTEGDGSVFHG